MSRARAHTFSGLAVVVAATALGSAQPQAPNVRSGWPCAARLDMSYFQIAEGTGGHLLLLAPEEIADAAALLSALDRHPETIARIAGAIRPGLQEFSVPVDASVESVLFSVSVQCLQSVEIVRPSGAPAIGADVTDLSNFRAERLVIVSQPEPGNWKVRVSGSGIGGIVVQARSPLRLARVEFAASPATSSGAVPRANVENTVRIRLDGEPSNVQAYLVSDTLERLAELPLDPAGIDGVFVSRVVVGTNPIRVLVTGRDDEGRLFQRLSPALLTPR